MSTIQTIDLQNKIVNELPRGGYLIQTSIGYIQLGSPPETIKDTMRLERGTPTIFILPNNLFHVEKGISLAELEFPIYYNFYLRRKKTYIVCTKEQKQQLTTALKESVFGPEELNLSSEYIDGANNKAFPNMKAEIEYFRGDRVLDDLVKFVVYDENNRAGFKEKNKLKVIIEKLKDGNIKIQDLEWNNEVVLKGDIDFNIIYDIGKSLAEPFNPPLFGITCLGPSHGFDPNANTSGFIIWLNHSGIMIDPPVNSTEWLRLSNVNPKLIDTIILTHCHADHDAGTFQKILEEGKITIYTTETVLDSFLRKYVALTKIPREELYELFDFVNVVIGKEYQIHGATFRFNYALHSIPSLGFGFEFEGKTFYYSSDHLNTTPEVYDELRDKGILTPGRCEDLKNFPWESDLIYHEAGIPPLHTRIDFLNSLPVEIQKKIIVYHIAEKDFPKDTHLRYAQFGIENTVYVDVQPPKYEEVYKILDALANVTIFKNFPISKAKEFISIVEKRKYAKGEKIIEKGTKGNEFYIILSGNVRIEGMEQEKIHEKETLKRYGTYEYFGEAALVSDKERSADVIAETEVEALVIPKEKFLSFIRNTDLINQLQQLNEIRKTGTWDILSSSSIFKSLTSAQKTGLELIMKLQKIQQGFYLIQKNKHFDYVYIIKRGRISVLDEKNRKIMELSTGDFCGQIFNLQKELASDYDFYVETDSEVYAIHLNDMIHYIQDNPGVYMKLYKIFKK
ncbi:MAG: cAMP/cGMP-dependent 3',5'-cyclic-AMP/GMP phosphodiesterase [Leptonema sp. (in: bacteria)]